MKKIPTIFLRDFTGDPSRVTRDQNPEAAWVFAGEGVATRKIDGTCCMIRDGRLFKRREVSFAELTNKNIPDFEIAEHDTTTGKVVGWVPVGDGPEDKWHREAFETVGSPLGTATFELIGPKIQGNPEKLSQHVLVRHGQGIAGAVKDVPRDFDGIAEWLASNDVEGLVFHHPDGRMAKIKGRDFGIKRGRG